jgi:alanine racemase
MFMAYIKINRDNFYYNLKELSRCAGGVDAIAIVLKDNAYGHGLEIMAKLSSEFGITNAVVKDKKEALTIQKYFKKILILNDTPIINDKFNFAINSIQDFNNLSKGINIELKIDTGMHRNGISIDEIDKALDIINKKNINLVGVMTHYKSADELGSDFFWQQKVFKKALLKIRDKGFKNFRVHSYNSSALLRTNKFNEDIARIGISAYGYNELNSVFNKIELKPVLSLFAKKVSSRFLKKGARIGYGGDTTLEIDTIISTYDLGYGDGWFRSNKIYMLPSGIKILGKVSMDFISLASIEDNVCIMNNAQNAAKLLDTISYEIITNLNTNIKRVIT